MYSNRFSLKVSFSPFFYRTEVTILVGNSTTVFYFKTTTRNVELTHSWLDCLRLCVLQVTFFFVVITTQHKTDDFSIKIVATVIAEEEKSLFPFYIAIRVHVIHVTCFRAIFSFNCITFMTSFCFSPSILHIKIEKTSSIKRLNCFFIFFVVNHFMVIQFLWRASEWMEV